MNDLTVRMLGYLEAEGPAVLDNHENFVGLVGPDNLSAFIECHFFMLERLEREQMLVVKTVVVLEAFLKR